MFSIPEIVSLAASGDNQIYVETDTLSIVKHLGYENLTLNCKLTYGNNEVFFYLVYLGGGNYLDSRVEYKDGSDITIFEKTKNFILSDDSREAIVKKKIMDDDDELAILSHRGMVRILRAAQAHLATAFLRHFRNTRCSLRAVKSTKFKEKRGYLVLLEFIFKGIPVNLHLLAMPTKNVQHPIYISRMAVVSEFFVDLYMDPMVLTVDNKILNGMKPGDMLEIKKYIAQRIFQDNIAGFSNSFIAWIPWIFSWWNKGFANAYTFLNNILFDPEQENLFPEKIAEKLRLASNFQVDSNILKEDGGPEYDPLCIVYALSATDILGEDFEFYLLFEPFYDVIEDIETLKSKLLKFHFGDAWFGAHFLRYDKTGYPWLKGIFEEEIFPAILKENKDMLEF